MLLVKIGALHMRSRLSCLSFSLVLTMSLGLSACNESIDGEGLPKPACGDAPATLQASTGNQPNARTDAKDPDLHPKVAGYCRVSPGVVRAFFSYENRESINVSVPVGPENFLDPSPVVPPQPTLFLAGQNEYAFSVDAAVGSSNLKWRLAGKTATATFTPAREREADCSPVPVTLLSFKGSVNKSLIMLEWTTTKELRNLGFHVEHWKPCADRWEEVAFVEGKSTDLQNESGEMKYAQPVIVDVSGYHYFRLVQEDVDGQREYFNAIAVKVGN